MQLTVRNTSLFALPQGSLTTYNYFENVWQFEVSNATFRLAAKAASAISTAPKVTADKIKLICVDQKLCQAPS
jgi:Transcription initiation factor IIA, gamma subunit